MRPRVAQSSSFLRIDGGMVRPPANLDIEPPGPASRALTAAARRLMRRMDEFTERVIEEIRKIPEYAALGDSVVWNEIRELTPASIRLYYTTVIEGRMPREEELRTARYFTRRRVEQGISLRAVRSAYASGVRLLWGELVREVGGNPKLQRELLGRSSWAFQHLDVFNSAVAEAYYQAQEGRSRHRDQLIRDLFDEIIDGDPSNAGALEARARLVELDKDPPLHVLILQWPASSTESAALERLPAASVIVAMAEAANLSIERVLSARRGRELLLVVPRATSEIDLKALRKKVRAALSRLPENSRSARAGLSGLVAGAAGLRQAYREAKRAIELGEVMDPGEIVHLYDRYVFHDIIDSTPEQGRRLIDQTIAPLLALGESSGVLVETLHEYFRAGLNLKLTAAVLDIHRNTLAYRMRKIREITRLDLENPEQRLLAENALQVLMLERSRGRSTAKTPWEAQS